MRKRIHAEAKVMGDIGFAASKSGCDLIDCLAIPDARRMG